MNIESHLTHSKTIVDESYVASNN